MRFFVQDEGERLPSNAHYPYVILINDNWDDFHFNTLFHPVVHLAQGRTLNLRNVKILKHNQELGRTEIAQQFDSLDDSYCSLGQELAYYESLLTLSESIMKDYLAGLKDAAADASICARFQNHSGFRNSLLRWGPAERALADAPALLDKADHKADGDDHLLFTFKTKFGANRFGINFRYCQVDGLPGRMNAIIGYNGTGKTQLLANLASVARAESVLRENDDMANDYGSLDPLDLRFGGVVAISYSAFDTFRVPSNPDSVDDFGYTYCGLRRFRDQGASSGLKDVEEIADEMTKAIARIDTPSRRNSLEEALQPLREEPSFARAGYELDILADDKQWRKEFHLLSAGHKISVNIIVQLVGALQQRSLVLIDEPESHLHPPLLAALMKGIGIALETHKSYAVIATHSPVVLQEIAGRYAHVLRRQGSRNSVDEPRIETFGENIGLLTSHVFNLDNTHSDYIGVLLDLASKYSLEEIEALFEHGLSSQARALVMQKQRG